MELAKNSKSFITTERVAAAVAYADRMATTQKSLSAFDCADLAVEKVFGCWLNDETGTVPVRNIATYYRLVDEVEQQLGLHRRRKREPISWRPVMTAYP